MRILHTSDLHIGKRLFERDRLPEQIDVLNELIEICDRENVSLVLIAGDVFDSYLPSAEAEEVFYGALKRLAGEKRAVVIVSGNHDDGVRLGAAAPFAQESGVYFFGGSSRKCKTDGTRPVRAIEAGENWIVIGDGKESVYINALPYPNEARLKEEKTDESYPEKIKRWIQKGEEGYRGDLPHILLSHLFVAGGSVSDGERNIDLGGARAVPLSVFPETGYVALGHLHKKQAFRNVHYSGSVLQYSFDEAVGKSVLLLETQGMDFSVREIPIRSGKKLIRLECEGFSSALELLPRFQDALIELTLYLKEPLTVRETQELKKANAGLTELIAKLPESDYFPEKRRSALGAKELFTEYYRSCFGEDPDQVLTETFLKLSTEEI